MDTTRRRTLQTAAVVVGTGVLGTAAVRGIGATRSVDETWTRTYDLDGNGAYTMYADAAARRDPTTVGESDALGTYVLAGRSMDSGDLEQCWALEVDVGGELRATTAFERDEDGTVSAVVPAPDGCVVVGIDFGPAGSITAPWTPWATKIGPGGIQWQYGKDRETAEETHRVEGATRTSDGGYVIVGAQGDFDSNAWMVRLDDDGSVVRERTFEREQPSTFETVTATDEGVIVGGSIGDIEGRTAWLTALDEDGEVLWERTYDDAAGVDLSSVRSVATDDGSLVLGLVGVTDAVGPVIAVADDDGTLRWNEYLFSSPLTVVEAIAPIEAGYAVGGRYVTTDSEYDYWLGTVARDGDVQWLSRYDDGGYFGDLVGDGTHALFAGNDGEDATARRFDPTRAPWQGENVSPMGTAETADEETVNEETTDEETADEETDDEESKPEPDADETSGFGVGGAVTGITALELLRRYGGE